jgi:hypothetical protein
VIPISHNMIRQAAGVDLTTTLLFPIIPSLWYNYGSKNVTLVVKPLVGTEIDFLSNHRQTNASVKALTSWYVSQDSEDKNMTHAFDAILDLYAYVDLEVNSTKYFNISVDGIDLHSFNVTMDNLGGAVKADEANILARL